MGETVQGGDAMSDCDQIDDDWSYRCVTAWVVESGDYDSSDIVGVYLYKRIADEVAAKVGGRVREFCVEKRPNLFSVYQTHKHEGKIKTPTETVLTSTQFAQFIKNNRAMFSISWRSGPYPGQGSREFGHFTAWGFTPEQALANLENGIKESRCEEKDV